ncbi:MULTISPECIES: ABC transporter permease [unclassified Bacillus (in: firmicutes)]|uniref:ABC transporter permease n=1 Tax=unclassified Bacillus (in: firmicutes) TaxID=185979 RepID=UPI0015CF02D0|nr:MULTISPECIES: ABC transporter permease subunit [unclassified Bacillus (in: firmicutes)]
MSNFIGLIDNELRKVFVQKSFIISLIILFIPIIVLGRWDYVEKVRGADKAKNWRTELKIENKKIEEELVAQNPSDLPSLAKEQKEMYEINKYRLKHNISTIQQHTVLDFMKKGAAITNFIGILLIYFASNMMSKEYQWKTINFLLVKPSTRRMIYYAKFISLAILYFIFSFAIIIYSFIIGSALNGLSFSTQPVLQYVNNHVVEQSILPSLIHDYIINLLPYLFFVAVAYFLSTVLRTSSVSLLISIILLSTSDVIATLLKVKDWSKFLPFMHTDLSVYTNGVNIENGMRIEFSITVLVIYILLVLVTAGEIFKKRDV